MAAVNAPALVPEAVDGVRAAQDTLDQHAARLTATGDPVADTVAACAAVVKASDRLMVEMQAQPVADMERAAHGALIGLRPAFEHRRPRQRWASIVAASAAGVGAAALVCMTTWATATAVARHDAGAEVARWQLWWNPTCADQSPRRVVIAGKAVCQVPMD